MPPLVSILIPVFNARPWVGRAIESALAQTWAEKEVIVLDDGSTDGSGDVIGSFAGRTRIERTSNGGQNVSRNRLTAISRGDWLVYLDADDELSPDNVARKMTHAAAADVLYGSSDVVTFRGDERTGAERREAVDYPDPFVAAFGWKYPNTSAFAFRRTALLDAGGWNETVKNCTDYALYFPLLAREARFKAVPDAWSLYRQWSPLQAVNEDPLRRSTTRLRLMTDAATALRDAGRLTAAREQAFLDASLAVIRTVYAIEPARAVREHTRLLEWSPRFRPSADAFPSHYLRVYRALGFATAEQLAAMFRRRRASV